MAKMKISELATEINVDKNEIVAFLQSTGFEVKSATKSIEDEQIEAIKAKFAPKPQKKAEAPKKEEKPAPKKEEAPVKEAQTDAKKEAKPVDAPLKKKKKSSVIIVGAGSNALGRNARPGQAQSARPVQAVPNRNVVLGPNQMINKATGKIMEKLPPKKAEEEKPSL